MTFDEWVKTERLNDEYYSRQDMYWFAEQAWNAAVLEMLEQEEKMERFKPLINDECKHERMASKTTWRCIECGNSIK